MMGKIKSILFVCTGNSCRSVMAEGLLKKMLEEKKKSDIQISSAGISAIGGFVPTDKTIEVMKKAGVDVSGYKTSKLAPDMIKGADLILTMGSIHKDEVLRLVPEAKDKTYLLREYADKKESQYGLDIEDPICSPLEVYERVFNVIRESIEELVKGL